MLSSLLTNLTSLRDFFSRAFLIAAVLPTLLFLFLNAVIFYLWSWPVHKWIRTQILDSTTVDRVIILVALFFTTWIAAYIVAALTPLSIRTLEGRNWWSWLREEGVRYHLERYHELSQQINNAVEIYASIDRSRSKWSDDIRAARMSARTGTRPAPNTQDLIAKRDSDRAANRLVSFSDLKELVDTYVKEIRALGDSEMLMKHAGEITLIVDYAYNRAKGEQSRLTYERNMVYGEEEAIAPTKFGNVGLSAQAYAMRAYHCNLALVWSALRRASEKEENTAKALENAKSQLDFLVACFWLSLGLAVEWAVLLALYGDWLWAVVAAITGSLICWMLWYGAAVEQYRVLQDLIIATLNALRFQVLTDLRFTVPIDLAEERELWRSIDFGIGGENLNLRYRHLNS